MQTHTWIQLVSPGLERRSPTVNWPNKRQLALYDMESSDSFREDQLGFSKGAAHIEPA